MIDTADIENKNLALLVVDIQNKFTGGPLKDAVNAMLPSVNEAISMFRLADRPIVFVKMDGEADCLPQDIENRNDFVDGLDFRDDTVINKMEMNAFNGTELASVLRDFGVNAVVICGLVARWCVLSTYFGAYDNNICPYLLKGCTASTNPEDTKNVEAVCLTVTAEDIRKNRDFRELPL